MPIFSQGGHVFSQGGHVFGTIWNPSAISGMIFWGNADLKNVVLKGGKVFNWKDLSGLKNDATQRSSIYRPSVVENVLNGYPALYFENTSTLRVSLPLSYFTIITVIKSFDEDYIYQYGNNINSTGFYLKGTNKYTPNTISINLTGTTSMKYHVNDWLTSGGTWKILTHSYNGTHSTNKLYINDTEIKLGTYGGYNNNPGALSTVQNLHIGGNYNNTIGIRGYIAEFIVYDKDLTDCEKYWVTDYLHNKYQTSGPRTKSCPRPVWR